MHAPKHPFDLFLEDPEPGESSDAQRDGSPLQTHWLSLCEFLNGLLIET